MSYIFVSAGYEITRESPFYRDWLYKDCNSMERNSTPSSQNVIDGKKQHTLAFFMDNVSVSHTISFCTQNKQDQI